MTSNQLSCSEHPDIPLIEDHAAGDVICSACGLVVGDRVVDVGSEWRTFSDNAGRDDPSRVGASENPLLEGSDLATAIGISAGPAALDDSGKVKYKYKSNVSNPNRVLLAAFRDIRNMADRLNLTRTIVDQASLTFKQIQESGALRSRSNEALATVCLFIACRQEGVPRTFKEICAISRTSVKKISRYYTLIKPLLGISVDVVSSGDFIPRFCALLGLPMSIQKAAFHVAKTAAEIDVFAGKSPLSVVAAAIYMVCQASDAKKTSQEVGEVAGVADVTVRQVYKLMLARAEHLFPAGFLFTTPIHHLPPK